MRIGPYLVQAIILNYLYIFGQQSAKQRQDQKMHHVSFIPNLIKNYHLREQLQSGKDLLISECLKIRRPQSVNAKIISDTKENSKYRNPRTKCTLDKNKDSGNEKQSKRNHIQGKMSNIIFTQNYKGEGCKQQQLKLNQCCKIEGTKKIEERKKSLSKEKHPIVRSFIIKDRNQQINTFLEFSCDNQHKIFENSLNQCINKTRINNSPEYIDENNHPKNKKVCQSFNNIKVKEILEQQTKQKHNDKRYTQRKIKSSYKQRKMQKEDRNTKTNKTLNCESPEIVQIAQNKTVEHYSNITQYPIDPVRENKGKNNFYDSRKINQQNNEKIHKDNLINENFSSKGNYNGYLWQVKQKKLKKLNRNKGSPEIELKRSGNHDFLNVKMLNFIKGSFQDRRNEIKCKNHNKSSKTKQYSSSGVYSPIKNEAPPKRNKEKNIQISELMVFNDVEKHTPRIRKISFKNSSPEKRKEDSQSSPQNSNYLLSNEKLGKIIDSPEQEINVYTAQDSDSDNSCYLRTRHFA